MQEPKVDLNPSLIDLTAMSLDELRVNTEPELRFSLQNVLAQADDPWIAMLRLQAASGSSGC